MTVSMNLSRELSMALFKTRDTVEHNLENVLKLKKWPAYLGYELLETIVASLENDFIVTFKVRKKLGRDESYTLTKDIVVDISGYTNGLIECCEWVCKVEGI